MTLVRPVYKATIQNVTAGWTRTLTAGDVPSPTAGSWVIDPLELSWSFESGLVPGQLDPDEATFSILAETKNDLPAIDTGDIILVNLERPTAGTAIPYMKFAGRVRSARLLQTPGKGCSVAVSCTDFLADLASTPIASATNYANQNVRSRVLAIAAQAGVNIVENSRMLNQVVAGEINPAAPDGATATEMLEPIVNFVLDIQAEYPYPAGGNMYSQPGMFVLRCGYNPALPADPYGYLTTQVADPTSGIYYYFQACPKWAKASALPSKLDRSGGVTFSKTVTDAQLNDSIIVLSARKIPVGSDRTKARDTSINQVVLTMWANQAGIPKTQIASWPDLVAKMGPNPRALETSVGNGNTARFADTETNAWLPDRESVVAWSFPDLTIPVLDATFTDAELDNYAPMFYPQPAMHGFPLVKSLGRPLVVVDVASDVDVDGIAMSGALAGCKFNVAGGRLTITPKVQARADRIIDSYDWLYYNDPVAPHELGLTWALLAANVTLEPTTWSSIDTDLTWADFRLVQN